MGKRVCMFCGGGKLTSAHMISRALQKLLPHFDGETERNEVWIDQASGEWRLGHNIINISPANHQVKRLCHDCNGHWMAGIEARTTELLAVLSDARELNLDADQQLVLATWATIVSMLRASQDAGLPAVTDEEMAYVRTKDSPPPGFRVWLVRGEHRPDVSMRHFRAHLPEGKGWFGWIWLGQAVLAVSSSNLAPHTRKILALLPSAVVEIHPARTRVSWPVERHVSYETLFALMKHQF